MDQGIICSVKCNYMSDFMHHVFNSDSSADVLYTFKKEFNTKNGIYLLASACKFVTQSTPKSAENKLWPLSLFSDLKNNENFEGFKISSEKT